MVTVPFALSAGSGICCSGHDFRSQTGGRFIALAGLPRKSGHLLSYLKQAYERVSRRRTGNENTLIDAFRGAVLRVRPKQ